MKTKTWILLFSLLLCLCLALSVWLFRPGQQADTIQILSDGQLLYTLPLQEDRQLEICSQWGSNTVTVENGAVAVTRADCPDGHCMLRGFCSGGAQIVCLPNRLVIRFLQTGAVDAVVG